MPVAPHVTSTSNDLPRLTAGLRPLINRVAAIRASVHTKLLAGFLFGALLLVAMAGLSVVVLGHMAGRVDEIDLAQERLDRLRQMQYLVTAQSHYRAMALLTRDDTNIDKIAQAKAAFLGHLDAVEQTSQPSERGVLARVRDANQRFTAASDEVLALYRSGQNAEAMQMHLSQEHPVSHEIEDATAVLLNGAVQQMETSQATFYSDQQVFTWLVVGFSALALVSALTLGFVLSWSFLLPLRTVHGALARIAAGRFDEHVDLPNGDEFGTLGKNLNATSQELAELYGQLEGLNAQLRGTNTELLAQLQVQVEELARSRGMITEAEERLRRELSEVLHSRVQNQLLMVWYRLEDCQELLGRDPSAAARLIAEVREQVDQIREKDVRELSHRLHPSIIRAGLLPALETLAEGMPRLDVAIVPDPDVEALDHAAHNGISETVRLTAYRVVEEALGNVAKHAQTTDVEVALRIVDGSLAISVRDEGRGFDPHTLRVGLGLGSIAARVERMSGHWTISSLVGQGTSLSVLLPCSVE
jgi:signal transduction histidine kinase